MADFDLLLHLGLGFGIVEIYIMAAHWMFIIPIAIGFLLKQPWGQKLAWIRFALLFLTVFLLVYNGALIYQFMMHLVV